LRRVTLMGTLSVSPSTQSRGRRREEGNKKDGTDQLVPNSETNLKIKQCHPSTAHLLTPQSLSNLAGQLRSEQPNNSLYTYEGTLSLGGAGTGDIPLGPDQVLLRGAQLRNTQWLYGLAVFTGHETKLMRNATYVLFPALPSFVSFELWY
jgi:magnesium-transporting ATPase (P-type)